MNDINSFHELLEHYRFTDAVPAPFRQSALSVQKRLLKKILKEVDEYTLFFSLCLTVLLLLSRAGVKVSLGGVKIVTAAFLVVGVTVPATYTAVKVNQYYQEKQINGEEKLEKTAFTEKEETLKVHEKRKITAVLPGIKTISFRGLRITGKDQSLAREFSGIVKEELGTVLGSQKFFSLTGDSRRADYSLVGSVRHKEAGYFVSLRIVEVRSGETVQGEYFTAPTSEHFRDLCRVSVEKLVFKIRKKNE